MSFTHQRISRKATCTKVTLDNMEYILELLNKSRNIEASRYGKDIMVRLKKSVKGQLDIQTINHGWWLLEKEDGNFHVMSQAEFNLKYQAIA